MTGRDWMYLFAASGHLTLAVLALTRGRNSPMSRPLVLLFFGMFGWCFASLVEDITHVPFWGALDALFTALTPPLALHLVVTFVGERRALRRVLAATYAVFGGLALEAVVRGALSSLAFVVAWVPTFALIVVLLVRHLIQSSDPDEKARTRTVMAALMIGGTLATTDVLSDLGLPFPHLASLGTLAGNALFAIAAFRLRLLDRDLSVSTALYAVALAVGGVVAYLAVFRILGGSMAALASGTLTVTLVLGAAVREVVSSRSLQRERVERHAVLGRFSSQMAHDLKNPLAALKGALQFLDEEHAQGRSLDAHHGFVGLMLEQVERLHRVVEDYQRIGRVEPICRSVDLNLLVKNVVALQPFAASQGVSVVLELAEGLPACSVDADLVSGALQNVVRNAFEAMPNGGALTVRTGRASSGDDAFVVIAVQDTGEGVNARHAARAFDDFYTTKAQGSGLGLAFVRRVARAHRGDASLSSEVGAGTIVSLRLPAGGGAAGGGVDEGGMR